MRVDSEAQYQEKGYSINISWAQGWVSQKDENARGKNVQKCISSNKSLFASPRQELLALGKLFHFTINQFSTWKTYLAEFRTPWCGWKAAQKSSVTWEQVSSWGCPESGLHGEAGWLGMLLGNSLRNIDLKKNKGASLLQWKHDFICCSLAKFWYCK